MQVNAKWKGGRGMRHGWQHGGHLRKPALTAAHNAFQNESTGSLTATIMIETKWNTIAVFRGFSIFSCFFPFMTTPHFVVGRPVGSVIHSLRGPGAQRRSCRAQDKAETKRRRAWRSADGDQEAAAQHEGGDSSCCGGAKRVRWSLSRL